MSNHRADPPVTKTPRRGRPPRIDRDRIVEAALEIGLEDISMRGVAERLGVTDAALYHHFANREALQNEVAATLSRRLETPAPDPDWQTWTKQFAMDMRAGLLQYPGLAEVFSRVGPSTSGGLQLVDTFVNRLVAGGFDVHSAARAYSLITSYLIAVVVRQDSLTRRGGVELQAPAFANAVDEAEGLSPLLGEVARTWLEASWDGEFEYGLDRIIDGLALQLLKSKSDEEAT